MLLQNKNFKKGRTIEMKKFATILLSLALLFSLAVPVMAVTEDRKEASASELTLRFISPEEMEQRIANIEAGVSEINAVTDIVLVSGKRVVQSNGNEYLSLTFLNAGFILDRIDVNGTVWLYDMNSTIVAKKSFDENDLIFGISRVVNIYPLGGRFSTGSYTLRVSDGDIGQRYTGSISEFL